MAKIERLSAEQRSNLVAYVDGELDDKANEDIERLLAGSPVARHDVEILTRTWEMLDQLPRFRASDDFTERTVATLQTVDVYESIRDKAWYQQTRRGLIWTWVLAMLACAGAAGFLGAYKWLPLPSDELIDHLPLVENLDLYQEVGDATFLEELSRYGDLTDGGQQQTSAYVNVPTPPEARREMVQKMSTAERERLNRNLQAYRLLPEAEKQRLHALEAAVVANKPLTKTMADYDAWLNPVLPLGNSAAGTAETADAPSPDIVTPWQRQALRQESDALRRIKLVDDIREEQRDIREAALQERKRLDAEWEEALNQNISRMMSARRPPPQLRIRAETLERMLKVLQDNLPPATLSTGELAQMSDGKRYVAILAAALKEGSKRADFSRQPLTADELEKVIGEVDDEAPRKNLTRIAGSERGAVQFVAMLSRAVERVWWERARRHRPSRRQLEMLAEKLRPALRAEFERRKEEDPRRAFMFLYISQKQADFRQDTKELDALLARLGLRRGSFRGRP